jgi:hypothetical protein
LFFILLIHILDKSKDYISSPYLNFNNAKGRGTIDITRNNTEIKFKYRVDKYHIVWTVLKISHCLNSSRNITLSEQF